MRPDQLTRTWRVAARTLLLVALPLTTLPGVALAADALIPHFDTGGDAPIVQQTGPAATGPSSTQLVPITPFVEDPARQAGGEDDAQRAYERQNERQNQQSDDDGDRRRK